MTVVLLQTKVVFRRPRTATPCRRLSRRIRVWNIPRRRKCTAGVPRWHGDDEVEHGRGRYRHPRQRQTPTGGLWLVGPGPCA